MMNKEALDSLGKLLSGSLYSCDVEQCNEDYDKVKDYINNLEQQLQAYKDKEEYTFETEYINQMQKEINLLEKYQDAWNELMNLYENTFKDTRSKNDIMVLGQLNELSKKHNLLSIVERVDE